MNMRRFHVYFPVRLYNTLAKHAKREGISVSELIRRVITTYLEQ